MMPICIYWQGLSQVLTVFLLLKKVACKRSLIKVVKVQKLEGQLCRAIGRFRPCFRTYGLFTGTAREAAMKFPANANVAATIALAGLGMDETMVELTVDPTINKNKHTIVAEGGFGQMTIELVGVPLPSNPKTSTLAALSVIRACRNSVEAIQI